MSLEINFSQGYFWLDCWVLANVIQLATQDFCEKFVTYQIDPCGRLRDQMQMAARSIPANIAEGTSRSDTSTETAIRLIDVARASNDELLGDYFNFVLHRTGYVWEFGQRDRERLWHTILDKAVYGNSIYHDAAVHVLTQKAKFDPWLKHEDPCVIANTMIVLSQRLNKMLQNLLNRGLTDFKGHGGFSENLTKARIEYLKRDPQAPKCPKCGAPMIKRQAKRGANSGKEFWSCSEYPKCVGTRNIEAPAPTPSK